MYFLLQPQTEEVKKEPTDRDVQEGFDITLTKHKGQVCTSHLLFRQLCFKFCDITFYSSTVEAFKMLFVINSKILISFTSLFPQYALRKLYHESPRLICVLYTSPTCGPCRTLKPILSKVENAKLFIAESRINPSSLHYYSVTVVEKMNLLILCCRINPNTYHFLIVVNTMIIYIISQFHVLR